MPLNNNIPTNTNFLQGAQFLLGFTRLPYMNYFCQAVNFPGVSVGEATQVNPLIDAPLPGDKLVYAPLTIKFIVDESMLSYTTILDWIKGYSFPENTDQYAQLTLQQRLQFARKSIADQPQYSDAMLSVYSNKNNPVLQLKFAQAFPVSLSSIDFATSMSAEDPIICEAQFRYTNYTINRFNQALPF